MVPGRKSVILVALMLGSSVAWADANLDKQMRALAFDSGCFMCHFVESGSKGPDGTPPIGPNWEDTSARYKGQKDAADMLVKMVVQGSASTSHWSGKVRGLAMPPNAVAISEPDARRLVNWILDLKK